MTGVLRFRWMFLQDARRIRRALGRGELKMNLFLVGRIGEANALRWREFQLHRGVDLKLNGVFEQRGKNVLFE